MTWEEGQPWTCTHCGRECVIFRGGPQDLVTRKRHSCEQYKKYIKANPKPKGSLSETFATHSDRNGKLVEVPSPSSGYWVKKYWRSEMKTVKRQDGTEYTTAWGYMTDEVYECNKNMTLFLAKYQRPMSEYFIPYDKGVFDYTLDPKKERDKSGRRTYES